MIKLNKQNFGVCHGTCDTSPLCCLVKQNYDQSKANLYLALDAKSRINKAAPLALINLNLMIKQKILYQFRHTVFA
jgi:hypothetical protein